MIYTPIKNPYTLSLNIRPIKIAYFLYEKDEEKLAHIIRLICTQWGGIFNLIIPISQNLEIDPLDNHFLETHQPERFVAYFPDNNASRISDLQEKLSEIFPQKNVIVWAGDIFERNHDTGAHALGIPDEETLNNASYG